PYGEGLLFGLGMDADEKTGSTGGMKLSMFDVSNPFDIEEKHKLLLDSQWSEALYNHKAILVLEERSIIAFPTEEGYGVYQYGADGFTNMGSIKQKDSYLCRGVQIGDVLYIVGQTGVGIFSLGDLAPLGTIPFS
ncbi:beta-propeller domain-containing protein, partial [Eubacteriales bacterium OttesenSCG-928-M02]|nr:beta-propeller domain-containing protein [Eubacteriales bacterium OttesenSCG-928-M02]